ncbi:hypothetical protein LguiA_025147 [Lonicera macranthoides]
MLTIFPLLQMTRLGYGRSIIRDNIELISDGLDSDLIVKNLRETTVTCEPLYGFLPCTTKISGQLFMIVVYQYLLSQEEKYVASASQRIAKIHGTGNILASRLSAGTATAEQLAVMGMQLLAGSAVMMLTLVWGACVAFGSSYSLTGFGLTTDRKTRLIARIMLVSMIPVIILQLTKMINSSTWTRVIILLALIIIVSLLIAHGAYQENTTFSHGAGIDDLVENTKKEIDKKPDREISEKFINAISEWVKKAKAYVHIREIKPGEQPEERPSFGSLVGEYLKAIFELLLGIAMLVLLSTPYLQTVWNFSSAANVAQFFVPYFIIPIALNVRMAYDLINTAAQKTQCSISLTLCTIYRSVYMNNMVGLTTFLILVYARILSWDVCAEVLVVLVICTTIGLVASLCKEFPFWTSLLAFVLYPISLLMLYVFTVVLG